MKNTTIKFGTLFLGLGLMLISVTGSSQDVKLTKQEQKEAQKAKSYIDFLALDSMLQKRTFVLEADYLENQYGNRKPVLSTLNFIMVDSSNVVLQTGSNSLSGTNGVGGATAEGKLKDLNIMKNLKNHSFWLRFTVVTNIGVYDVDMTIYSDRNAKATITGLTRGRLVYDGRIQNLYDSRVYKGRNSI